MTNEQTGPALTVFAIDCHQGNDYDKYRGLGLDAFIEKLTQEFPGMMHTPIAWAAEYCDYSRPNSFIALRDASIATGRVIKLIDGKYVPFGEGAPLYCDAQGEPIADMLSGICHSIEPVKLDAGHQPKVKPAEPERAPLDWACDTPFNPFKGYAVDSSVPDLPQQRHTLQRSPDLERQGHQVRPGFALAAVRQVR